MKKVISPQTRSYIIIAIIMLFLLTIGMACNLLNRGDAPEEPKEDPALVVNEEVEEPVQQEEEPVEEAVAEEQPEEEIVEEQPAATSDELYLTGEQGVIVDDSYVYGVFMIKNPKTDCSYEDAEYLLTAYDDQNQELYTEDGYLEVILPGSEIGELIYFPEEAQSTHHFEVTLTTGTCSASDIPVDAISFSNPAFYPEEYWLRASAHVINGLDTFQTEILVIAVGYDANNDIVAVGSSYVNVLFPDDYSGVMVTLNRNADAVIDHVEFYGTQTYFTETSIDGDFFDTVFLINEYTGSIQIEDQTEFVFFMQNDHETMAATDVEYQVTLLDDQDFVIMVQTGYIEHILPGDVSPVYLSIYLPEDVTYDRYFVELLPGEFIEPVFAANPFTADNYTIDESGWSPVANFDLTNTAPNAVSDLDMVVLLYDVDGYFIGGGKTSSDTINPNSVTNQEIYVSVAGEAETMEVYLVIDYWTEVAE